MVSSVDAWWGTRELVLVKLARPICLGLYQMAFCISGSLSVRCGTEIRRAQCPALHVSLDQIIRIRLPCLARSMTLTILSTRQLNSLGNELNITCWDSVLWAEWLAHCSVQCSTLACTKLQLASTILTPQTNSYTDIPSIFRYCNKQCATYANPELIAMLRCVV